MMYTKRIVFFSIFIAAFTGCVTPLYMPTVTDAEKMKVSLESLSAGRTLYMEKCGSCHSLKQPSSRSHEEWVKIMDKMQPKAKINDIQRASIMNYLETNMKTK